MDPAPPPKYWAFISYSHADRKWAEWLHRRIETYRIPRALVAGEVPQRAFPVFRDRDELGSAADLNAQLLGALSQSRCLVVICSPQTVNSRWVNEEIRQFCKLGRADRVFAFIVDGEPKSGDCFPPALLEAVAEPIAADARPVADGKSNALLKLLAGMLRLEFDQLRRRDYERQLRTRTIWSAVLLLIATALGGLAFYANHQRGIAEERQRIAFSRQLATEALAEAPTRLDRALLLAVESHHVAPTAEAKGAMLQILQSAPGLTAILPAHERRVTALAISPGGHFIASGSADGTERLWAADGRAVTAQPLFAAKKKAEDEIRMLAFSPDEKLLASGGLDGSLRFAETGQGTPQFVRSQFGATIVGLAFHPAGKEVMVASTGVMVMDPAADKAVPPPFVELALPNGAAISPDGATVVADLDDKGLVFFDYATRTPKGEAIPSTSRADVMAFSRDGGLLAVTSRGGELRVADLATRQWMGQPVRGAGYIMAVAFSEAKDRLVTVWSDGQMRAYGLPDLKPEERTLSLGQISAAAISPDLGTLVTGHEDGTVRLYRSEEGRHALGDRVTTAEWLNDVAYSPDGRTLAVADEYGITLRDLGGGPERRSSGILGAFSIAYTPDGKTLAVAGREGVRFWDLASGAVRAVPSQVKEPYSWRIALTPDGRWAAFSGKALTLWDLPAGKALRTLPTGKGSVYGVAVDSAGAVLAAGAEDKSLYLFKLPSGEPARAPIPFGDTAWSLAFSPDGKTLIAGGNGGQVAAFDVASGARIERPLPTLPSRVNKIVFNAAGTTLALVGMPRGARMVDWATLRPLGPGLFPTSEYEVISGAAFSPDGHQLVLSERRQQLWLLDGDVERWRARACRLAGRDLTEDEWARYVPDTAYRKTCSAAGPGP